MAAESSLASARHGGVERAEVRCASRICAVTVYARGALVTRRLELPAGGLPAGGGALELVVEGVSPLAESGSFRVDVVGQAEVLGVSSRVEVPGEGEVPGALLAELRELRLGLERLQLERNALLERRQLLGQLEPTVGMRPRSRYFEAAARVDDALAVVELADELRASLDAELTALEQRIADHQQVLLAAEVAAEQARSSARVGRGHPTRTVSIRLGSARGAVERIELTYAIGAARWWPVYTVRLDHEAQSARLTVEAYVAQLSLEDWDDVEIALATADLSRDTALPELPTWRMGRAQPAPRSGYRPPPPDLEVLFAGYDKARAELPSPPPPSPPPPVSAAAVTSHDGQGRRELDVLPTTEVVYDFEDADADAYGAPPAPQSGAMMAALAPKRGGGGLLGGMARAAAAPVAEMAKRGGRQRELAASASGGSGGFGAEPAHEPEVIEPSEGWLDFDALVMASDGAARGKLQPRPASAPFEPSPGEAVRRIEQTEAPGAVQDPRAVRGQFDHLYRAAAPVEVASGVPPVRLPLIRGETSSRSRFRCVAVEASEVFREVELDNPFDAPLLSGPLDVFVGGAMVTTSAIEAVDRGGRIVFGLGVEERLRAARNARVTEQKGGIFGGRIVVEHQVEIEVVSALGHEARIDLIDRVPVVGEEDGEVEVKLVESTPEAERYDQAERGHPVRGGLRWQLVVPPGGRTQVRFRYDVALSAKREVVGGNRRD